MNQLTAISLTSPERKCVGDTDIGRELKEKIKDLEKLLNAYYSGAIAEKFTR